MMTTRGQALIELVAFLIFSLSLVSAFLGFTKSFLIRQKLLIAAREGMLLYSSGRFTEDEVRGQLLLFLKTGTPQLIQERVAIRMGNAKDQPASRINALQAQFIGLDYITVRYTSQSLWLSRLGLDPILEESCYVKHANGYGPSIPPLWGPPVRP
jgi:hypothetical protein